MTKELKQGTLKRLLTPAKKYDSIKERLFNAVAQISWFETILLPIIYPIKTTSDIFVFGSILFLIGMVLTIIALHN